MSRVLLISDGKPGHFNQSIALCQHLGFDFEQVEVRYKNRICKTLSYFFDRLGIYTDRLFDCVSNYEDQEIDLIVSTGSSTYYPNKVLARKVDSPNVAILYPRGYRLDFSHIFCPFYDHPPRQKNITEFPLNLCAATPSFFQEKSEEFKTKHTVQKPAVGIIIGGANAVSELDPKLLQKQLEEIFVLTEGMERWLTTSRRTPAQVETLLAEFDFDYKLINSKDSYNPIPAFIHLCDRLFVTSDSASMVSECASFGRAKVEVLMNRQLKRPNKFEELIRGLESAGAVHIFDGSLGEASLKIDLKTILQEALSPLLTEK
jgi:mitochondrial fission protein ELM1